MDKQQKFATFILPILAILLIIENYSRLTGTENVHAAHNITLIALDMVIGILLQNIIVNLRASCKNTLTIKLK